MKKPIILLILKALEGRGAERMVTTLAHIYVEMDYEVHVLCLESTQEMPLNQQVNYHLVPHDQVFLKQDFAEDSEQAAAYRTVAKRIDNYVIKNIGMPNLILVNIYKLNWIMAYSQLPNIVNVLHTALSKQFQDKLLIEPIQTIAHLKMVYGAHPCSCVSDGARQDLLALIGDINNTTTIYNPCAIAEMREAAAQAPNIKQFELAIKGYIIHVGSFDSMKNHRGLLQAYARTERKVPLVLVGKGTLENEIKQLATQLNIADSVKFLGFQPNPYPLIAKAALLVLSSKFEGFGYVIAEAQALEVAVISTDCPFGPRELLPEQNLIKLGDIDGLARLIEQALADLSNYQVPLSEKLQPERIAMQYLEFSEMADNRRI